MKKVLVVADFYYPHWTGISKSIYYLTKALQDKADFTVLTVQYEKKLKKQEKIGNIRVFRQPFLFTLSRAKYSILLIGKYLQIAKNFDVVLINSPCSYVLFVSIVAKLLKKRLIIFHQGDLNLPASILNRFIQLIFNLFSVISFDLADELATYTEDYADNSRLLPLFKDKTTTFVPPLPYAKPKFIANTNKHLKKKLACLKNKHKFIIGFAGRFSQEKGFDVLFKAIEELEQDNLDLHFVFAGETHLSYESTFANNKYLLKKIKHKLSFLGLLNQEELWSFYQALDLFVLPSRSECFALVQAEAALSEVPILVSNIPGARDLVKQTNFGLIFESESHLDLASKIREFVKTSKKFSQHHNEVKKYFDYENATDKALQFIEG